MTGPALVVMPDAIILTREVLAADAGVSDAVGERIFTRSPDDVSAPWIRLHRIGGPRSLTAPMRLVTATVQVDCFAPFSGPSSLLFQGDPGAMKLALLAEAAMFNGVGYANADGIITKVTQSQGVQMQPDTSRKPPTPRVLFTLNLIVHPIP